MPDALIATQRICKTSDGEICDENDPRVAAVVVTAGHPVPAEYVERVQAFLGESVESVEPDEEPAPADEHQDPEEKQAEPAPNKKAPAARNKKS